jgi:hypothetical protein
VETGRSERAQTALIDAQEAFLIDSATLLARLREELVEIEESNDVARKREVIEQYVRVITVETRVLAPRRKEADVRIARRLEPKSVAVVTDSPRHSGLPRS